MNELTRQIDDLRRERDELLRDMRGINPAHDSYRSRLAKVEALWTRIEDLRQKRGDRRPYKASYGVETIPSSAIVPGLPA